ncbi:MAG: winged helix-turn-helix domain-containing protein [Firmicutes bacterium]|nr:winged helix-turn-helix domain-containing protein [Bacillota bacterium]
MPDVAVISAESDVVFARMLVLELSDAGISAALDVYGGEMPDDARIAVVSADIPELCVGYITRAYEKGKTVITYGPSNTANADVHFARPFPTGDFISAVRARLPSEERTRKRAGRPAKKAGLILSDRERTAVYNCETVALSGREYELLKYLYDRRGTAVSREELNSAWGGSADSNNTDVYIRYLRQKLDERFGVRMIETVRGCGYRLKTE